MIQGKWLNILAETLAACRWVLAETLAACGFLGPSIPPFHLQNQELRRSNAVILIYNHFCSVKTCLVSHYHKLTNCYHSFSPEISSNFNPTYSCLHSVQFRTSNVIPTHHRDRAFLLPEYKYRPALDSKRKSNERTTTFCLGIPALHTYIFIIQLQCIWILLPSLLLSSLAGQTLPIAERVWPHGAGTCIKCQQTGGMPVYIAKFMYLRFCSWSSFRQWRRDIFSDDSKSVSRSKWRTVLWLFTPHE